MIRIVRNWLAIVALALVAVLVAAPTAQAQTFPKFTSLVVDDAHILAPEQVAALDAKLTAIQKTTGHQLAVATIADLQGYPIEDYSYRLGRAWGVGDKKVNDGLLLIIAPKDRKLRIEVGPGLQGTVTDALSSVIISTQIAPKFKAGDYAGGINAGVDQLSALIQLPPEEAQKLAAQAAAQQQAHLQRARQPQMGFGTIVFLGFMFLFVILPMLRAMRGGGRRYGPGGVAVYPPGGGFGGSFLGSVAGNLAANAIARELGGGRGGGWGGGSDGGGFGGSDFGGGGGGSFDGGGSSGSW